MKTLYALLSIALFTISPAYGQDWLPCGSGTNHHVRCVLNVGQDIYVSGLFRSPGKYIAIYHPASDTWDSLNVALNGDGNRMVRDGDYLYVGGNVSVPFNFVGRYDLITKTWHDLNPPGWSDEPRAMIIADGKLFVAHGHSAPNFITVSYYNINTGAWTDITNGTVGPVLAFAWDGSYLYMGGDFLNKGSYIARLHLATMTWDDCNGGVDAQVNALTYYNNKVYVGGNFRNRGRSVATYDPATDAWSPLDTGFNSAVYALFGHNGFMYAGGDIIGVGNGITRFNPTSNKWEPLPDNVGVYNGVAGWLESICELNNHIYVGGLFTDKGNYIAKWSMPLSVAEIKIESVKLYPDPAKEVLHLEFAKPLSDVRIAVYDALGRPVVSRAFTSIQKGDIDIRLLSAGLYFMDILATEGVASSKFLKSE